VDLNADDRICLGVEIVRPAQGLNPDCVLLQRFRTAIKDPRGEELQKLLQHRSVAEGNRLEDPMNLPPAILTGKRAHLIACSNVNASQSSSPQMPWA
jgi:hypothetical protein